jgi:3,5-epimerase/4-reductase
MNILIYGGNGWIGQQICEYLKNKNIKYVCGTARCDNYDSLQNEILHIKPSHVISLIGRTHGKIGDKIYSTIDYLEESGKLVENINDNLYSPLLLAIITNKLNIHFTYIGTGCIFEYDSNHLFGEEKNGFNENDKPNFYGSSYSIVKGYTDRIMHLYNNVLNLRIRMPITNINNPRNFITKIITYDKICSIPNSMTVLPNLIPVMIELMLQLRTGTINFANHGLISHNEILELYKELIDPTFTWKNFTMEEQNKILSSKRSNNYLDTDLLKELSPNVLHIKDAVRWCLQNWKNT